MRIRILNQVSERTAGGHHYAAMEGTVTDVDDHNKDMINLAKWLVARGDAQFVKVAPVKEPDPDTKTSVRESADVVLDQLRARAEAAGVKIDRRWGAERLSEEIAKVETSEVGD